MEKSQQYPILRFSLMLEIFAYMLPVSLALYFFVILGGFADNLASLLPKITIASVAILIIALIIRWYKLKGVFELYYSESDLTVKQLQEIKQRLLTHPQYEFFSLFYRWPVGISILLGLLALSGDLTFERSWILLFGMIMAIPVSAVFFGFQSEISLAPYLNDVRLSNVEIPSGHLRQVGIFTKIISASVSLLSLPSIFFTVMLYQMSQNRLQINNLPLHVTLIVILMFITALITAYMVAKSFRVTITKLATSIDKMSKGVFSGDNVPIITTDEIGFIGNDINGLKKSLQDAIGGINTVMKSVADGDFTRQVSVNLQGELHQMKTNINSSISLLSQAVMQVSTTSLYVKSGATELLSSSQTLAKGTTEQAASLEEVSSTMNEIDSQAKTNNENASNAKQQTVKTLEVVKSGTYQMEEMLKSIHNIKETSDNVSKIIKVIDEIAFQTNLLALNAAVEAARAGKYGKGFAVVAEEVRNLAARSTKAARDTTDLIKSAIKEVGMGVENAEKTADILNDISTRIENANIMIGKISDASLDQSAGIGEINKGMSEVNNVIQQNSSISEETSSASENLSANATQLQELIARFKVKEEIEQIGEIEL